MTVRATLVLLAPALLLPSCAGSCRRAPEAGADAGVTAEPAAPASAAVADGAPRPGMAWIPPGVLRAGTPPDRVPRVADEEMPGVDVPMQGFYIDLYPYPNEPGAIPTSNVTREEAAQQCAAKGKRLCTELEWERACKGPDNTTYEYGDAYRAAVCGTGTSGELAARTPSGEHAHCKSAFGVADMHGVVWEWTQSPWGRGASDPSLGVLRGGNAQAGELVGRCANAIGRKATKKAPTMGFRCCAGPLNEAEVTLALEGEPGFTPTSAARLAEAWKGEVRDGFTPAQGWSWIPRPNEKLAVLVTCTRAGRTQCDVLVGRQLGEARAVVVRLELESNVELARVGEARRLRLRALDTRGSYTRDVTYVYGRVEVGEPKRP